MSGLEVLGGISAVIAIIDESIKIWKSVRKDLKLSGTFDLVVNRLPILRDTLETCHEHFKPLQSTLPADAATGLIKTMKSCEISAKKLHTIFDKTIPGDDDQWYERYRKAARSLGKGNRVEELMKGIAEYTQDLVNYHSVKSVRPELGQQLEEIVAEMKSVQPSLPEDDGSLQNFNAYGGHQYVSTGSSTQHVNVGSGPMNNFAGITGNVSFNQGPVLPAPTIFSGTYSHFGWRVVATYVSRPDLERQLEQQLPSVTDTDHSEATRTVVVWGLGGVGKSQLVLHHTHMHRGQYQNRFWLEAGSKQTLDRDYLQIHRLLFPQSTPTSIDDAITAVKSWFHGQVERSLWVMDSADAIEDAENPAFVDLDYYLPDGPYLDRIVTTRISRARGLSSQEAVQVTEMADDEAVQLFRACAKLRQTGGDTEREIELIVRELGCLALAVMLAGYYVGETPQLADHIEQYLPRYRAHRKRLLSRNADRNLHRYSDSVLRTWEMSFAAIERRSPVAARLLTLLAFVNFDDIFLELFTPFLTSSSTPDTQTDTGHAWWIEQLSSSPEELLDECSLDDSFALLRAYSLVSWREKQAAYAMHKLVHAWGHDRLDTDQRWAWSLGTLRLLSQAVDFYQDDFSFSTRLVPHMMANFATISAARGPACQTNDQDRDAISTVGSLLDRLGRWKDKHDVQQYLLWVTRLTLGDEHPETLRSMNNLATVFSRQGEYEKAAAMHRQTLELRQKVLGSEHPETLTSMSNLAQVLTEQGEYEKAAAILRQTLELEQKVLGSEHPGTLISMNNLATVLSGQGEYKEAAAIHRQTLELQQKVLGPEHPSTLISINNLATVLSRQGEYEEAAAMHRQTLELMQKVLGSEHPNTLTSMNNLAQVLTEQGEYEEAAAMHRQTLELQQKVLGSEHPETLTNMNNLATVFSRQGEYEKAAAMHRQTLGLQQKVLGSEHPETLTSMNNLAQVLTEQGEYEEAATMHRQTLELMQKVLGPEHPNTLTSMNNLAQVLTEQGEYEEAATMHQQTLELT